MTMIMMMLSMYLIKMNHPLSMGLILLLQTSLAAMLVGLLESFWFSYMYMLFLTMMSGMLVLFMYMSSIASNEMFNSSLKSIIIFFIISPLSFIEFGLFNMNTPKYEMYHMQGYKEILEMMKLFSNQMMWITIMMVMYLLFTMIVISYIVNIYEGPMRYKS